MHYKFMCSVYRQCFKVIYSLYKSIVIVFATGFSNMMKKRSWLSHNTEHACCVMANI